MSEATLAELQKDLAALRQELDGLRTRMAAATPQDKDLTNVAVDSMQLFLKQRLAEKGKGSGVAVGGLITQIRANGGAGASINVVTLHEAADLPTDEQIAEKIARLSLFVQNPLVLRTLRCLLEPHFENQEKRRTKADLAASLGVGESEIEAAMTPLLDQYEVTWGKDALGQEYYDWTGNGFAMLLLIVG